MSLFTILWAIFLFEPPICLALSPLNANTQPLDIRKLFSLDSLNPFVASPDSTQILYGQTSYNQEENNSASFLSILDISTGSIKQITPNVLGQYYSSPLWIDNHTIAYVTNNTLYTLDLVKKGAEAEILFSPPISIDKVDINGNVLTFSANVYPNSNLSQTAVLAKAKAKRPSSAQIYDNLRVRYWDKWMGLKKETLFSCKFWRENDKWVVGDETNLMQGLEGFSDPLIRWSLSTYSVDQHGNMVAFVSDQPSVDMAFRTDSGIYLVNIDNPSNPTILTDLFVGVSDAPVFSPDGKYLAWLQADSVQYNSDFMHIYVYDIAEKVGKFVAKHWDRSPKQLLWDADGQSLYAVATDMGSDVIFSVDIDTGNVERLTGSGYVSNPIALDQKQLVYAHGNQDKPFDIHIVDVNTKATRHLTQINSGKLEGVYVGAAEDFWFTGALNDNVHGWIIKPLGFDPSNTYPLALIVHGGPQDSSYQSFDVASWNPNVFASAGFVTVTINYHGSIGYGSNFTSSINRQWGGYPYEDIMKGLDHLVETFGFIDESKMVALGASYGGYMMNWINGQTNRFRALVSQEGIFSTILDWYSTDVPGSLGYDFGGPPYLPKSRGIYKQFNPEQFASNFSTPMLFFHGAKDYRVCLEQSLAPFTLLRSKHIPARLVYYPDENHWTVGWGNQITWFVEVLEWISKFTNSTLPYDLAKQS